MESEVRAAGIETRAAREVLPIVEQVVYRNVTYAFDWDTWGVMDWLPTVDEVLAKGREDCDGRAVVAASLLRRLGYDAHFVTDLKHAWVATPEGELMAPGAGEKTMTGDPNGTRLTLGAGTIANLGRGLAFGVSVFPLGRELIIVAAIGLLTMHPWSSMARRVVGGMLLVAALAFLRAAGAEAQSLSTTPAFTWGGLSLAIIGWLVLAWQARRTVSDGVARRGGFW